MNGNLLSAGHQYELGIVAGGRSISPQLKQGIQSNTSLLFLSELAYCRQLAEFSID